MLSKRRKVVHTLYCRILHFNTEDWIHRGHSLTQRIEMLEKKEKKDMVAENGKLKVGKRKPEEEKQGQLLHAARHQNLINGKGC